MTRNQKYFLKRFYLRLEGPSRKYYVSKLKNIYTEGCKKDKTKYCSDYCPLMMDTMKTGNNGKVKYENKCVSESKIQRNKFISLILKKVLDD